MSRKLTTEQFIQKAIIVHGDDYDYSLVEYKGAYKAVKIICREHGVFEQMATNHTNGYGCPNTAHRSKRMVPTRDNVIERAITYHGYYYDYSLVELNRIDDVIKIICPEHGI